ncbi:RagB/SusD family nutrient uptake outer membrane protein [Chitinophaga polysaccharea]|uniref:RagB/SusD family nutrient uptake outer membrane protein n=1 Tax=Chitinophaga polysaccharea TaxID=1293035 RepID=UPI0014554116|nr:RagB/SusD family nutrient uptake outer membrane protein [Chitinophaga polysaccharea]NLR62306.1 RagB/SusD family nutrient uptake outer membrane protein [Chitinophaga polysaccharea]
MTKEFLKMLKKASRKDAEHLSRYVLFFALVNIATLLSSCKKLVEINSPTTSITGANVFTNNGTAAAVLTGIYTRMSSDDIRSGGFISTGFLTGLSGDELTLYPGAGDDQLTQYYTNSLLAVTPGAWNQIYPITFITNTAVENIQNSTSLTFEVQKQLLGEAKFMRAFCYFYLINLYGDVPLVISSNYAVNSVLARSPKEQIWAQMIADLKDAKSLLSDKYLNASLLASTTERVRPTKWAATAMLARAYLYTHDWKNAEEQSTEVINSPLYHLDSLNNVFLSNNPEAIWQLQPVTQGANTIDAQTYILHSDGLSSIKPVYLSDNLLNSFEKNDQRANEWIDTITISGTLYYFSSKYKSDTIGAPLTEYNTILRLGEQFLIRSEARTQQNNLGGALSDLNMIRRRAWLSDLTINNQSALLNAIYHERQVELFTEWGHRWFDMKRNQSVNSIMNIVTPQKGGSWSPNWQLYPVPPNDILVDANLTQNPGY